MAVPQRKLRHEAARKQLETKLAKLKAERGGQGAGGGDSGEYGISWGFDEDAVAEEDEEEDGDDGDDGEVNPLLVCCRCLALLFPQVYLMRRGYHVSLVSYSDQQGIAAGRHASHAVVST